MSAVAAGDGTREYRTTLAALLEGVVHPLRDVQVTDLAQDSREVRPGTAFLACQGRASHGIAHAAEAVGRGALDFLVRDEVSAQILDKVLRYATERTHTLSSVSSNAGRYFRSTAMGSP